MTTTRKPPLPNTISELRTMINMGRLELADKDQLITELRELRERHWTAYDTERNKTIRLEKEIGDALQRLQQSDQKQTALRLRVAFLEGYIENSNGNTARDITVTGMNGVATTQKQYVPDGYAVIDDFNLNQWVGKMENRR